MTAGLAVSIADRMGFEQWGRFEAMGTALWNPAQGRPLSSYGFAWFVSEEGAQRSLLTLKLEFEHVHRTILLAELNGATMSYLPDSLVVAKSALVDTTVELLGGTWTPLSR